MPQEFYQDSFAELKIQLRSDEPLGQWPGGSYVRDDLDTPNYIALNEVGLGAQRYSVLMTEEVSAETVLHTVFSGYQSIEPEMIGVVFALGGTVRDVAGNVADLSGLQFTILVRHGEPIIVVTAGTSGGLSLAVSATGKISVRRDGSAMVKVSGKADAKLRITAPISR